MVEGKRRCFILFLFVEVVLDKVIFSIIIANHISFHVGGTVLHVVAPNISYTTFFINGGTLCYPFVFMLIRRTGLTLVETFF